MNSDLKPKARGRSKRTHILDAAREMFLRDGFLGTSMDRVADHAQVSKQTVYAHFKNKEALLGAVVRMTSDRAVEVVQKEIGDPIDAAQLRAQIKAFAVRQLEAVLTQHNMRLGRLVISEVSRFPQFGAELYENGPHRDIIQLAAALDRWGQAGLIMISDPLVAATQLKGILLSDWLQKALFLGDDALPSPEEIDERAEQSVTMFLAAYGADRTAARSTNAI